MPDSARVRSILRAASRTPVPVDTRTQRVTIKTRRGNLYVGPHGRIEGLPQIMRRELRTKAEVQKLCGNIGRETLLRWRRRREDPFPAPTLTFPAAQPLELWSRTEVEDWLARNR